PDGSGWIEGNRKSIAPLKWSSIKGEPEWDRSTECKDLDWPTQLSGEPAGGPGALAPGHWITRSDGVDKNNPALGMVNGWRFYWTSGIEFDRATGTFGLSYDLLAFWYTYQLIDGVWSPVWLYCRRQAGGLPDGDLAEGERMHPGRVGM